MEFEVIDSEMVELEPIDNQAPPSDAIEAVRTLNFMPDLDYTTKHSVEEVAQSFKDNELYIWRLKSKEDGGTGWVGFDLLAGPGVLDVAFDNDYWDDDVAADAMTSVLKYYFEYLRPKEDLVCYLAPKDRIADLLPVLEEYGFDDHADNFMSHDPERHHPVAIFKATFLSYYGDEPEGEDF